VIHALASGLADALGVTQRDSVLPIVPQFHVNAWGLPYSALMVGAKLVMPGERLDPQVLREGMAGTEDEIRDWLGERVAKWWLRDRIVFVDVIPRTGVGKFLKRELRERFATLLTG